MTNEAKFCRTILNRIAYLETVEAERGSSRWRADEIDALDFALETLAEAFGEAFAEAEADIARRAAKNAVLV